MMRKVVKFVKRLFRQKRKGVVVSIPLSATGYVKRDNELVLSRHTFTDRSTVGNLMDRDKLICMTLEDTVRQKKIYGETAIPAGRYRIRMADFKGLGDHPLLMSVPFYQGIFIHRGNFPVDTHGCILVGLSAGDDRLFNSADAFAKIMPIIRRYMNDGELWLRITGGYDADQWEEYHAQLDKERIQKPA